MYYLYVITASIAFYYVLSVRLRSNAIFLLKKKKKSVSFNFSVTSRHSPQVKFWIVIQLNNKLDQLTDFSSNTKWKVRHILYTCIIRVNKELRKKFLYIGIPIYIPKHIIRNTTFIKISYLFLFVISLILSKYYNNIVISRSIIMFVICLIDTSILTFNDKYFNYLYLWIFYTFAKSVIIFIYISSTNLKYK